MVGGLHLLWRWVQLYVESSRRPAHALQGINMGTRFMCTEESPIHQKVKEKIVTSTEADTIHIFRYVPIESRSTETPQYSKKYCACVQKLRLDRGGETRASSRRCQI
jgi:hypothetical protein